MKKRKVLFITPSLCHGGLEQSQISMLQALDPEKFDSTLFYYIEEDALRSLVPDYVKVVRDKDDNHYFRDVKAFFYMMLVKGASVIKQKRFADKYSKILASYIHEKKMKHPAKDIFYEDVFDVVVANAVGKPMEIALHMKAEKRFVFFRSSVDLHHELHAQLFPMFDGIVAVSGGVKEMLQKTYPHVKEKVLLLENYVDAESILNKADEGEAFVDRETFNISSCGRLSSEKGFDLAVEAAAILQKKGYQFRWYFIGDGPERDKIESLIKKYELDEKIRITGFTDNPFPMIKESQLYVQPSYEESYGRTIKEAQILGCPVVSTDTVGGRTLIKQEETGILTEISPEALAEGIELFLKNQSLLDKYKNQHPLEMNKKEKQIFQKKLEDLLS